MNENFFPSKIFPHYQAINQLTIKCIIHSLMFVIFLLF